MVERQRPTSAQESPPLHERGGLTLAHWEVLAKITPKASKVREFAKAVLDGRIDPSNFSHREYLGRRHWRIVNTNILDATEGFNKIIGIAFNRRNYQLTKEVKNYVVSEDGTYISLNDIIKPIEKVAVSDHIDPHEYLKWDGFSRSWQHITIVEEWELPPDNRDILGDTNFQSMPTIKTSERVQQIKSAHVERILSRFVLLTEDVQTNAVKLSPQELLNIAQTNVQPEKLQERIRERGVVPDTTQIGGWEKLIPQA